MKKQLATGLLTAALVLGTAACAPNESSVPSGTSGAGPGSDAQTLVEQLQVSQEFLESLRGMEVTRVYPWALEDPDVESESYKLRKQLEEEYGFTLTDKGISGNYNESMVPSLLAGKPYGDIMLCPEDYFNEWFQAGVMADLTPAAQTLGIDFTDELYEQNIRKYTAVNGGQYGYGYAQTDYSVYCSLYYNKRILEENQLEDPFALREKGEWTFDKLAEYARICKKTNADGTVEQWGLGSWTDNELMIAMINANDGSIVSLNENNQLQLNLKDAKTQEALEYMYRWCNVDKLVNVSEGGWEKTMADFVSGKYAFMLGTGHTLNLAGANGMTDEFGVLAFPEGPSNTSGETDYSMHYYYWFIPQKYQDQAAQLLYIHDLLERRDTRSFEERFEETYLLKIPDETSYNDFLERSRKAPKYELFSYSGIVWTDPGIYAISTSIFTGQSTPGSIVDRLYGSLESTLKDHWEGITFNG